MMKREDLTAKIKGSQEEQENSPSVFCIDASETCLYRNSPLFFPGCPTPNQLQHIFIWKGHLIKTTENLFYQLC
jgi:hypothetical protein